MKSGEVEDIHTLEDYFAGKVLIGRIENLRKHPDADRLNIFDVDLGDQGKVQIVSAAPNVSENLLVPVATIGAKLPMGTILERKMRGEVSQGMCCGMSELLLETEYSSGLWELNELLTDKDLDIEKVLGKSICEILPEFFPKDSIYDIKYLADKISASGNHLGLAVEIAICLEKLELLTPRARQLLDPAYLAEIILQNINTSGADLEVKFTDNANYANSFLLFDLKLESHFHLPHELQKRMFLTERNLIGGLADLSNYILYDIGEPTHFFSKTKVLSLNNESKSLDWKIQKLTESTHFEGLGQLKSVAIPEGVPVLWQQKNILTIPGISGGENTKVDEKDKDILVEIASFPAENIARSSFSLNYRSEGARIWAGGVSINLQFIAIARLIEILKTTDNECAFDSLLDYISPALSQNLGIFESENLLQKATKVMDFYLNDGVEVDLEYIANRLDNHGLDYWQAQIEQKLRLFGSYQQGVLYPNIFYSSIRSQEDILEQVARLVGYDILQRDHLGHTGKTRLDRSFESLNRLKQLFLDYGFFEIISRPFVSEDKLIGSTDKAMELLNPANSAESYIRDSIFTNLANSVRKNILHGEKDIRVFEYTTLYTLVAGGELISKPVLEGMTTIADPYLLTSLIHDLASHTKFLSYTHTDLDQKYTDLGNGFSYDIGGIRANLLKLNNKTKRPFDIPLTKDVWYIALDLTDWDKNFSQYNQYFNESEFSILSRNYSYLVDQNTTWKQVEQIYLNQPNIGADVRLYPIERLSQNDKDILNFRVDFVSYTKNLESSQIDRWEKDLIAESKGLLQERY
jgi:phenylalanyl-tRNA synthetase beta chain